MSELAIWLLLGVLTASGALDFIVMAIGGAAVRFIGRPVSHRWPLRLLRGGVVAAGVAMMLIGALSALRVFASLGIWALPVSLVLLLLSFVHGVKCIRFGRRLFSTIYGPNDIPDPRGCVLWLRPFASERLPSLVPILPSEEEHVVGALRTVGHVLAVGDPGDEREVPPAGALRVYLPASDWQPFVARLIKEARLVVLKVGDGEGFWWESSRSPRGGHGRRYSSCSRPVGRCMTIS